MSGIAREVLLSLDSLMVVYYDFFQTIMNVSFSLNIPLFVVLVIESVNRCCRWFSSLIWSVFRMLLTLS